MTDKQILSVSKELGFESSKFTAWYVGRSMTKDELIDRIIQPLVIYLARRMITFEISEGMASETAGYVSLMLFFEGLSERASTGSRHLKCLYGGLYYELRIRNLDLLFFVVEKPLAPLLRFLK